MCKLPTGGSSWKRRRVGAYSRPCRGTAKQDATSTGQAYMWRGCWRKTKNPSDSADPRLSSKESTSTTQRKTTSFLVTTVYLVRVSPEMNHHRHDLAAIEQQIPKLILQSPISYVISPTLARQMQTGPLCTRTSSGNWRGCSR